MATTPQELFGNRPFYPWSQMTIADKWINIKSHAEKILSESGWTQLSDNELTPAEQTAWQTYRETIQNISFAYASPDDVVFPDPPIVIVAPATAEQLAARARRKAALGNAKKAVAINKLTIQQARTWLTNKVHSGDIEQNINTLITNAVTVADLKPILTKINRAQFAQTKADEEILELLFALRDKILSEL